MKGMCLQLFFRKETLWFLLMDAPFAPHTDTFLSPAKGRPPPQSSLQSIKKYTFSCNKNALKDNPSGLIFLNRKKQKNLSSSIQTILSAPDLNRICHKRLAGSQKIA